MAASPSNIGKSLLKFFKPVLVALPHRPGRPGAQPKGEEQSAAFQLLRFKRDEAAQKRPEAEARPDTPPIPIKVPTHWLEFILNLLLVCRRVSEKMRQKIGISAYRYSVEGITQQRIKTVGSIIDVRPEYDKRVLTGKRRRSA